MIPFAKTETWPIKSTTSIRCMTSGCKFWYRIISQKDRNISSQGILDFRLFVYELQQLDSTRIFLRALVWVFQLRPFHWDNSECFSYLRSLQTFTELPQESYATTQVFVTAKVFKLIFESYPWIRDSKKQSIQCLWFVFLVPLETLDLLLLLHGCRQSEYQMINILRLY